MDVGAVIAESGDGEQDTATLVKHPRVLDAQQLQRQGLEVLVTRDTNVIVGIVGPGRRGESAEVRDVLQDPNPKTKRDRLLVRWGNSDGIVVEMSDELLQLPEEAEPPAHSRPKVGDLV